MQQQRHIHKVIKGNGTPIILLHGLTGSSLNWNKLTRELNADYKTIAVDFIGHSRSSAPLEPSAYSQEAILEDIDQLIETEADGKAILCGLSMGAAAMLLYTLQNPAKVTALILTSYPPGQESINTISGFAVPFANKILEDGIEAAGEQFVWGPTSPFAPNDAKLIKQGFLMHKHPHGLALCMREFLATLPDRKTLLPQLAQLTMPILIIAGECDKPSLDYSHLLSAALPAASNRFEIIKNGGHLVNIDSYKRYNAVVSQFLEGLT